MMKKSKRSHLKVALVTESLWRMAGSNRVLDTFAQMFPQAHVYALFGERDDLSENLKERKITFSFLNRLPFIKKMYRYTFHLWPVAIEQFDFSKYGLVISISSSVAHGVVTPLNCKHLVYVNTPMRYAWDLSSLYRDVVKFGFLKNIFKEFFLTVNRTWDVVAAQRADILVSNSNFVAERIKKYWDREVNDVIYPPFVRYSGEIVLERNNYFVAGSPFEPNKKGDFLLECAAKMGFELKLLGSGSMKKKLKRKYKKFKNIEFLDWVSEERKWEILSNAKGFIIPGIEDYGIFCAEAISCGTPVLAYREVGSLEILEERSSGIFFGRWDIKNFQKAFNKLQKRDWDYKRISNSLINTNSRETFLGKIESLLVE